MDRVKIEEGIRLVLEGIGEDPNREGLLDTPKRVAKMYMKTLNGYTEDPKEHLRLFTEKTDNMVIVKDIPFFSYCEHHLVPFIGKIHIGYIPKDKIIGISKLVRLARVFCKRLQVQERLTDQIADILQKELDPQGVMVYIEAEHGCMVLRGVRTPGAKTITAAVRGVFTDHDKTAKAEFMLSITK